MRFSEAEFFEIVARFLWPFIRISALFVAMPIFSNNSVPRRVRTLLVLGITLVIAPTLPAMPKVDMFSIQGFLVGAQQVLVGVLFGFILNLVFASIVFAGNSIANSMGLGFASIIDPLNGVSVPVIAQFYLILATLLFLTLDGHLLMIQLLAESFQAVPIGPTGIGRDMFWLVVVWSAKVIVVGLLLGLPLISALLLINLGFGVASRAAPQLSIFSVGFPVSLLLGLLLVWVGLPNMMRGFTGFLNEGYKLIERIIH